jgi:hypothetical protein
MSVAVYSRLGELPQARKMTVSDLQGQIAARFRLSVGVRALDRLTREPRVRRPDMEVAAAAVLGVGLGDLFAVDVTPCMNTTRSRPLLLRRTTHSSTPRSVSASQPSLTSRIGVP